MLTRSGSRIGLLTAAALSLLATGCRKEGLADQAQVGAAVGEVMASADESANGGSATAMIPALPTGIAGWSLGRSGIFATPRSAKKA